MLLVSVFALLALLWARNPVRRYWLEHLPLPQLATYAANHAEEADAALCLARRQLAAGSPDQAEPVLAGLTARDPGNGEAWLLRSRAEFEQGKVGPAYASVKVAMQFLRPSADAHWRLGLLLERRGDEREAESAFRRAVEIDPNHPGARMELARESLARRHYAPALEHLKGVLRREPRNSRALALLSTAYRNLGDLKQAEQHARAAVQAAPNEAGAWQALAEALHDQATEAATREAERAYRRALELEPGSSELHHQLGRIYFSRRDYAKAADELQRAIDLHPLNRLPYPTLIQSYLRLGQKARAANTLQHYEKVNEMDLSTAPLEYSVDAMPENTAVRVKLARLYLRYGRPDLASAQIDQVLALNPNHPEALRLCDQVKSVSR